MEFAKIIFLMGESLAFMARFIILESKRLLLLQNSSFYLKDKPRY